MNKLNGEFEVGDKVTIYQWHYNENLDLKDRLNFPINGTIKEIISDPPQYGIKVDDLPETKHKGMDNLWWFYKNEMTLFDSNPFRTRSFFTGKNTTPPEVKKVPNHEIIELSYGRVALVTKDKVHFFLSATEAAVRESFKNNFEDFTLADYVIDIDDLERLYDKIEDISEMWIDDYKIDILKFKIGCQEFTYNELDDVTYAYNRIC